MKLKKKLVIVRVLIKIVYLFLSTYRHRAAASWVVAEFVVGIVLQAQILTVSHPGRSRKTMLLDLQFIISQKSILLYVVIKPNINFLSTYC